MAIWNTRLQEQLFLALSSSCIATLYHPKTNNYRIPLHSSSNFFSSSIASKQPVFSIWQSPNSKISRSLSNLLTTSITPFPPSISRMARQTISTKIFTRFSSIRIWGWKLARRYTILKICRKLRMFPRRTERRDRIWVDRLLSEPFNLKYVAISV